MASAGEETSYSLVGPENWSARAGPAREVGGSTGLGSGYNVSDEYSDASAGYCLLL